ncbi:MAG TPA: hypothetical protein VNI54_18350 [Thermoanaerobaculia bacterium]|nr:hypothetical protein [Thermoanaerobaculia bacterium]
MAQEPVFRFLALRQPRKKKPPVKDKKKRPHFLDFALKGNLPPVAQSTGAIPRQRRTEEAVAQVVRAARDSDRYVRSTADLPAEMRAFFDWTDENGRTPVKDLDFKPFAKLADDDALAERLAETLYADALLDTDDENSTPGRDFVARAIKLLHIINDGGKPEGDLSLNDYLARVVLVIPDPEIERPPAEDPKPAPPEPEEDEATTKKREELRRLIEARNELIEALDRSDAVESRAPVSGAGAPKGRAAAAPPPVQRAQIALSKNVADALSPAAKQVLAGLKIDNPYSAVNAIEQRIERTAASLPAPKESKQIRFGGVSLDADQFMRMGGGTIQADPKHIALPPFAAGVGDLLIVKQTLKRYELADFAHVENILKGELREREHRRLSLREETITVETSEETEKDRDLQSTDRNEMLSEAEETTKRAFGIEGGTAVSATYGPVTMSANMKASFESELEETKKTAVKVSREVTEKISEKLRTKVREERKIRILEQTEEINKHKIDNSVAPTGNTRGIYRWLNKVYDAQVFRYGQRMMYDFFVPEPAAWFLWAMVDSVDTETGLTAPVPPRYKSGNLSVPLRPEHLDSWNYQPYLLRYEVTGVKAPPQYSRNVAWFGSKEDHAPEGEEPKDVHGSGKVAIPEHYKAHRAIATAAGTIRPKNKDPEVAVFETDHLHVYVGGQMANSQGVKFDDPIAGEISINIWTQRYTSYSASADIFCVRTNHAVNQWQLNTFDAIMSGYLRKKSEYEERLAQLEMQKGPVILGRNPLENRRLVREELKKLVIMIFTGQTSINAGMWSGTPPVMNLKTLKKVAPQIRFFENAFEWSSMSWVLYPYFWGRPARWTGALRMDDPDPDFAAFLRAGGARVQVPVRPGFEKAVAYFSKTGNVWNGSDAPLIGDDLYVSIIDEITENLGKPDEDIPYVEDSKPWEVTVPTTLVMLQDPDEIKALVDSMTGEDVQP